MHIFHRITRAFQSLTVFVRSKEMRKVFRSEMMACLARSNKLNASKSLPRETEDLSISCQFLLMIENKIYVETNAFYGVTVWNGRRMAEFFRSESSWTWKIQFSFSHINQSRKQKKIIDVFDVLTSLFIVDFPARAKMRRKISMSNFSTRRSEGGFWVTNLI